MAEIRVPHGELIATVDTEDRPTLTLERDGETVLEPSPLGIAVHGQRLGPDAELQDRTTSTVTTEFETVAGKRQHHSQQMREAVLTFNKGTDHPATDLVVRVADDGVAYRYRVHTDRAGMVVGESSGFQLPQDGLTWVHPHNRNHESTGRALPVTELDGTYSTPVLCRTGSTWLLLGEAGVDGSYAASRFASEESRRALNYQHPETPIWTEPTVETPWRVAIVGTKATVVESSLIPALDGEAIVDPSADWVRPGRVTWSWWSDSGSPSDPSRQREFVEYAAEQGWEYILVDEGWDEDWLPDLVADARNRGVGVFLWAHWTELHDTAERERRFDRWADWGVAGVKIDFMDSDEQGRLQFYDQIAASAAEHGLLVNFHGSVVPTGQHRRWPHVLTYEGVKGAEYYKTLGVTPEHNAVVPFTRNAVGPMDYTPVTFDTDIRHTSDGHELALSVVFESGLQHFADSPESYAAWPAAEWFLERVPARWDETVFMGGYPGAEATLARRSGDDWFVGSVTAGPMREVTVDWSFLEGERTATLIRDHDGGLTRETTVVDGDTRESVPVAENGGFVAVAPVE